MIVADVNLLTYLLIEGEYTQRAEKVLTLDPISVAPRIWRHEFVNVIATQAREARITLDQAFEAIQRADDLITAPHAEPDDDAVVRLAVASRHATYDCEFVVLARMLRVCVVTNDTKLCEKFRDTVLSISEFVAGRRLP